MNEKKDKVIKMNYKDKDNKYEIEVKVGEKKELTPKDKKDGPKITVEGKEAGFLKNKILINNEEKSAFTTAGWACIIVPSVIGFAFLVYFLFFRKRKNKHEEEAL